MIGRSEEWQNMRRWRSPDWVNKIFRMFEGSYDYLWKNTVKTPELLYAKQRLWFVALKKYPENIVLNATMEAITQTPAKLPTIGAICEIAKKNYKSFQDAEEMLKFREQNKSQKPEPTPEGKIYIANLRKLLGMPPRNTSVSESESDREGFYGKMNQRSG